MPRGTLQLDKQGTTWTEPGSGGPLADAQLIAYTGTWTISAAGPGAPQKPYLLTEGFNGAIMIELAENNVGVATLNIEGSFDAANWYAIGYYQVDGTSTLTRAATAISMGQNARHVYQVLDAYPMMRVRPSANAGSVTARFYLIPV